MKKILLCLAILTSASASFAKPQSMQILRNGFVLRCDPQTPPPQEDEDWSCSTTESDRTGDLLEHGCKGSSAWACVVTVKEECTEHNTGRTRTRSNKEFRGCAASLGDCF